jgi:hypothetical protein
MVLGEYVKANAQQARYKRRNGEREPKGEAINAAGTIQVLPL